MAPFPGHSAPLQGTSAKEFLPQYILGLWMCFLFFFFFLMCFLNMETHTGTLGVLETLWGPCSMGYNDRNIT